MIQFPTNFFIGASTAAHQVEGNNIYSDYWLMENLKKSMFAEPSGDAVNHYKLYREDIAMMVDFGLNAYRFSIEWARIEPEEGEFNDEAINHYRDVLLTCKKNNITPLVTLHHFTSPKWLIRLGGWESEQTPDYFARYCAHVMKELGELIPYVCTINEANIAIGITRMMKQNSASAAQVGVNPEMLAHMQAYQAELGEAFGMNPKEIHTFLAPRTEQGMSVIFQAHVAARTAIKQISPDTRIGITMSLHDLQSIPGGEKLAAQELHEEFLQFLPYLQEDDFFGLQNYTREVYGPEGVVPAASEVEKTQMGYEYYPQGLESVIRSVYKHLNKPIIVTENGVATEDDHRRVEFIDQALKGVHACISDGIPVYGYMHWSLLDNFEWQLGYSKHFGLVAVDRSQQLRIPKPSAYHLGKYTKLINSENFEGGL